VPHSRGLTVVVGTVDRGVDLYDAAALLHDGQWAGVYHKHYLPNYGVFDENRYFAAGREQAVFDRDGVALGVSICEDIWFAGGPVEEQVVRGGAELILNLSASPYHGRQGRPSAAQMLRTRARDHLAVVAYVNMVGGQDEVLFDGASLVVDPQGEILGRGRASSRRTWSWPTSTWTRSSRAPALHDSRLRRGRAVEGAEALPRVALPAPAAGPKTAAALPPGAPARDPLAEVYDALVHGTRDYVRKNGFDTVVLGLSGGIDSALCACVACDALGPRRWWA